MQNEDYKTARDYLEETQPEDLTGSGHIALAIYELADAFKAYLDEEEEAEVNNE